MNWFVFLYNLHKTGLGTACKEETSRMKNVSIESSGGKKLCLWVEENCIHRKILIYTRIIMLELYTNIPAQRKLLRTKASMWFNSITDLTAYSSSPNVGRQKL
jgi:hypothetical protein